MKKEYKAAVDAGEIKKVRMALSNELLLDPRGESFNEMLSYAVDHLPALFEDNKEASYTVPPKEQWDENFMFEVKRDLDYNFSKEKLAFYEAVVKVVGKDKAVEIEEEETATESASYAETNNSHSQTRHIRITKVSGGTTVGGAVLSIAGICFGKTLLTIVGGAILVGGVLLIVNDNKK